MEVTSPSGYVTLVKADGSGLIFSTFLSGSKSDSISFAALTTAGIYLAGQAGSVDLPGFNGAVPSQCVPVGFVTRMTLDGAAISSSRTPTGTSVAYDSTTGTLLLVSGNDLLRFDPSQATSIACMLDAADLSPVTAVAPGELLSMFGRFLHFETNPSAVTISPINGSFPVKSHGLGIVANQTPPPFPIWRTPVNVWAFPAFRDQPLRSHDKPHKWVVPSEVPRAWHCGQPDSRPVTVRFRAANQLPGAI